MGKLELQPVEQRVGGAGNQVLIFKHKAVAGMDSPGYVAAGQEYHVTFSIPKGIEVADGGRPARLVMILHGFGDGWQGIVKFADAYPDAFVLIPNDPLGTWFYGYSDQLPGGDVSKGMVVNYTERRLLAYLEHFQKQYPAIDKNRIFVTGGSMGGTGSTSLALRYP